MVAHPNRRPALYDRTSSVFLPYAIGLFRPWASLESALHGHGIACDRAQVRAG